MQVPLSITTSTNSPYNDSIGSDGLIRYRYLGINPNQRDNVGLRFAMDHGLPLVYFRGLVPGKYLALWARLYHRGCDSGADLYRFGR